jgi:hypothetical protein
VTAAPLVLPQPEFSLVQRLWAWYQQTGHAGHGGFTQDSRDPDGYLQCACGDAVLIFGGVL